LRLRTSKLLKDEARERLGKREKVASEKGGVNEGVLVIW